MTTMEIRKLRPGDDLFAVSRVYEESWREAYRGLLPLSLPGGAGVANRNRPLPRRLAAELAGVFLTRKKA